MQSTRTITHAEWVAEAKAKYGNNMLDWVFKCPSCGHITKGQDWRDLNADEDYATSCIGRSTTPPSKNHIGSKVGPCNYAGYGLFQLNPVTITNCPATDKEKYPDGVTIKSFEFAS